MAVFATLRLVVLVCVYVLATPIGADWTTECPSKCTCKWASGKKVADCTHAGYSTVPATLSMEIQVLDLSFNPLHFLPRQAFSSVGLVNLQRIYVRNCSLDHVDKDAFQNLSILIEIDLSSNLLEKVDRETFSTNERLRFLFVSHNPLEKLDAHQFPLLPNLRTLELINCNLKMIDKKALMNLRGLETLKLADNKLPSLQEEVLLPLVNLKSLDLQGNPWVCDCHLIGLRQYLLDNNLYSATTVCLQPQSLAGRAWSLLNPEDLACPPSVNITESWVESRSGLDVTFACRITGNPLPKVQWLLKNRQLVNSTYSARSDQYMIRESAVTSAIPNHGEMELWSNLTLRRISDKDAGQYRCQAENKGGASETNATLHLPSSPVIVLFEKDPGIPVAVVIGIAGAIGSLFLVGVLVVTVFLCRRHKRPRRALNKNNISKINGNGSIGIKDSDQEKSLLGIEMQDMTKHLPNGDGYEVVSQTELLEVEQATPSASVATKTSDALGEEMNHSGTTNLVQQKVNQLAYPASLTTDGGCFYPDLLNIPHHSRENSLSAISGIYPLVDSNRLAVPLCAARLAGHPNYTSSLALSYHHPIEMTEGTPSNVLISPATNRPGYVTLPRHPAVSIPSWASTTMVTATPLSTRRQPMYDTIGPRITADGSSTSALSLSKIASLNPIATSSPNPRNVSSSTSPDHDNKPSLPAYYLPVGQTEAIPTSPLLARGSCSGSLPSSSPNMLDLQSQEGRCPAPGLAAPYPSCASRTCPAVYLRDPGSRASIASVENKRVVPLHERPSAVHFASHNKLNMNELNQRAPHASYKVPSRLPPKPNKTTMTAAEEAFRIIKDGQSFYENDGEDGTEV